MNTPTLSEQTLSRLLAETAETLDVPPQKPVRAEAATLRRERRRPHESTWFRVSVAASMVLAIGALALTSGGSRVTDDEIASGQAGSDDFIGAVGDQGGDTLTSSPESAAGGARSDAASPGAGGSLAGAPGSGSTGGSSSTATTGSDQGAAVAPGKAAPTSEQSVDQGRIIKTAEVALNVPNGRVSPTLGAVQQVATLRGGLIFSTVTEETGEEPSGVVTMRVPVTQFEQTISALRNLSGVEVRALITKGQDVTAQFSDTQTQIRTLTATRERYLVLLGDANTVGEVLAVQQRVDQTSLQIDRLQGELNLLASRSDMSTVTVSVREAEDVRSTTAMTEPEEPGGFSGAWDDAKDGFTGGIENIVAKSGTVLLVGLVLLVLGVVGSIGYRLVRRRMA